MNFIFIIIFKMNTVFDLHNAFKRSQLEIISNIPYKLLWEFLKPYKKEKLPESVVFKIAAGKKNYDVIRLFESGEYFFSQKFLNSGICYRWGDSVTDFHDL